jgi:hypothetical protein
MGDDMNDAIIIRHSTGHDRPAILALAALDSRPAPAGEALLAFAGRELRAVVPLDGGEAVADPFHRTAEVVDLLRLRADQTTPRRRSRPALALRSLRARVA